jgi:ParB-like chromosome segregation protein Spo0J
MKPKIEHVKIESLIPYARNSRTHSDAQVAQIAASIKEFGFTNPILIDGEGGIIAGHGRLMAARKLNLSEVPCIRLEHLTKTQVRALVIADNKLALNAEWNMELLKIELGELDALNFNLELTGFVGDDLTEAMFGKDLTEDGPEEFSGDAANKWQLLIEYDSETQLAQAFDEATERGLKCKIIQ